MAVANAAKTVASANFEKLVIEYKHTLACCSEGINRLEAIERKLHDAAAKLGVDVNSVDLPNEIGGMLQAAIGKEGATPKLVQLLSERELFVFTLVGQGLTTKQIAERLTLATSTVETYRERLKHKLELPSGAALVREAVLWVGRK
jgi:DNA-binding NarL/FixJ family response regulator